MPAQRGRAARLALRAARFALGIVMTDIQTFIVKPGTPELAICARWRAETFAVLEASYEKELRSLELFASDPAHGVALVAKLGEEPIGTCLLVESEIEPNHDVSPWLAGLFVVPEHRRRGAGATLVHASEDEASHGSICTRALRPAFTQGSVGWCSIVPTGRVLIRPSWLATSSAGAELAGSTLSYPRFCALAHASFAPSLWMRASQATTPWKCRNSATM